jgi:phosphate:Na+ symporter
VLRDLRWIHSHICSAAYPVLDAVSELAVDRGSPDTAVLPETQPMPRYR